MRIVFVRHGDPNYKDDCLTELGHQQAALAAQRLKDEGIVEIYTSSCGRACETAQHTADVLGLPVHPAFDFMREINWGNPDKELPYAGHPWAMLDELTAKGVRYNVHDWAQQPCWAENTRLLSTIDTVEKGTDEWMASLGYQREGSFYRVTKEAEQTNKTVAMFAHGGSGAAFFSHLLSIPFTFSCMNVRMYFTSISILTLPDTPGKLVTPQIELLCDDRHITKGEQFFGR